MYISCSHTRYVQKYGSFLASSKLFVLTHRDMAQPNYFMNFTRQGVGDITVDIFKVHNRVKALRSNR